MIKTLETTLVRAPSQRRRQSVDNPSKLSVNLVPAKLAPRWRLLGPLLLLTIWELTSRMGFLSPATLTAPSAALLTGYDMLTDGTLLPHFVASATRAYIGLALGVMTGVVLALLSGYINTHAALRGMDIGHIELAKTLHLTRSEFIRKVALPAALPGFFVALRLAVGLCWTALVVLELINTQTGIGYLMNRARDWGQTDIIVVGIIIYAVLGLASDALVRAMESRVLSYRRTLGS